MRAAARGVQWQRVRDMAAGCMEVAPPLVVCHGCGPSVAGLGVCSGLGGDAPDESFCQHSCWR
jgi:hypothetical protein